MNTLLTMSLQELDEFRRPTKQLVFKVIKFIVLTVVSNFEVLCLALWFCNCYCVECLISLCLDVVLLHPFGVSLLACPTGLAMGVSEHHEQSFMEVFYLLRSLDHFTFCVGSRILSKCLEILLEIV